MRQPVQQLIERYQNSLYAAAFNTCQNQMDAEDVVQETFSITPAEKNLKVSSTSGHGFFGSSLIRPEI